MAIYVETQIDGSMDELWNLTQQPDQHEQWDLRFTDIQYLPRDDGSEPQHFRYSTRLGFGLSIQGEGVTTASRGDNTGERSSALTFSSQDPKSLIRSGAGYWKYIPTQHGVRFLTRYDYRVRFGWPGRIFDALVFRPLMHWATAWSFDRLRLWVERGITPADSLERSLVHGLARIAVAFIWIYHGLVPKLLFQHSDELTMLADAGISSGPSAAAALNALGCLEVILGSLILVGWRIRWPILLTAILMMFASVGVVLNSPQFLVAAFNPVSLNLAVIVLSLIAYLSSRDLPSASRCLLKPPEESA